MELKENVRYYELTMRIEPNQQIMVVFPQLDGRKFKGFYLLEEGITVHTKPLTIEQLANDKVIEAYVKAALRHYIDSTERIEQTKGEFAEDGELINDEYEVRPMKPSEFAMITLPRYEKTEEHEFIIIDGVTHERTYTRENGILTLYDEEFEKEIEDARNAHLDKIYGKQDESDDLDIDEFDDLFDEFDSDEN